LQEGCSLDKERGNLFAISLDKIKVKIKTQGATDSFETIRGSSSYKAIYPGRAQQKYFTAGNQEGYGVHTVI
jgi:hypothetical protein